MHGVRGTTRGVRRRCTKGFPRGCRRVGTLPKVKGCATKTVSSFTCKVPGPTISKGILQIMSELLTDSRSVVGTSIEAGVRGTVRPIVPRSTTSSFGRKLVRLNTVIYIPGKRTGYRVYPLAKVYRTGELKVRGRLPIGGGTGTHEVRREAILVFGSNSRITVQGQPSGKLLTNVCRFPGLSKGLAVSRMATCDGSVKLTPVHIGGLQGTGRVFDRVR